MAVENYAGATMAKGVLAMSGKVSAATFALSLGTVIAVVVCGAAMLAQMKNFEIIDRQNRNETKRRK